MRAAVFCSFYAAYSPSSGPRRLLPRGRAMPGPYLDDATIQLALADELGLAAGVAGLTAANKRIALDGRDWAYNELVAAAAARGLTTAQLDTWKRREEYEKCIGLWWSLDRVEADTPVPTELILKHDRRAELYDPAKPWVDEAGDVLVPPEPATAPQISGGPLSTKGDVTFWNERGRSNVWER